LPFQLQLQLTEGTVVGIMIFRLRHWHAFV